MGGPEAVSGQGNEKPELLSEMESDAAAAAAIVEERPASKPHPRKSSSRFIGYVSILNLTLVEGEMSAAFLRKCDGKCARA